MTHDTVFPTGILLSADERTLYVAENSKEAAGSSALRAYPIRSDGTLGPCRVLQTFSGPKSVHGMCLDDGGNVVACVGQQGSGQGPAIAVISAAGELVESHAFQLGKANNCAFGGRDLSVLYITTDEGHLCQVEDTGRRGSSLPLRR
jgi:gluconolactonase